MSGWTFAWADPEEARGGTSSTSLGKGAAIVVGLILAIPLLLYATGMVTALGSVDGSERHDRRGIYLTDESRFGLPTMYVRAGQHLWWDYDVTVEGRGGLSLSFVKSVPSPDFHVRVQRIERTARGRFEVVVPQSGFYRFEHELIPPGVLLAGAPPGSTHYRLSWGTD